MSNKNSNRNKVAAADFNSNIKYNLPLAFWAKFFFFVCAHGNESEQILYDIDACLLTKSKNDVDNLQLTISYPDGTDVQLLLYEFMDFSSASLDRIAQNNKKHHMTPANTTTKALAAPSSNAATTSDTDDDLSEVDYLLKGF